MARVEETNNVNDIAKCLADLPVIVQDVMRVYEDIEGSKIGDLIQAITQLIQDGQVAVADCQDVIREIVIQKMNDSNDIQKCLADLPALVQDALRVYEDIEGEKIGDLIQAITQLIKDGQVAVADCKDVIKNIVIKKVEESRFFNLPATNNVNDIAKCLADLPVIVQDIMRVYEDVEGSKIGDLIQAIQQLIQDGQIAVADCQDVIKEIVIQKINESNDIQKCLADLPALVQDAMRVYEDIEGSKIGDLIQAITQLIKDGQVAVADCKDLIKGIVEKEMERL